jgi:hypothetical protein
MAILQKTNPFFCLNSAIFGHFYQYIMGDGCCCGEVSNKVRCGGKIFSTFSLTV